MRTVTRIRVLGIAALAPIGAVAAPESWIPLLSEKHAECSTENTCRVRQKSGDVFDVTFDLHVDPKEPNLREFRALRIRREGKAGEKVFEPRDVARAEKGVPFEFYSVDLRGNGDRDLALLSFTSPHHGSLYHYFLYDPKEKAFRAVKGTYPALLRDAEHARLYDDNDPREVYRLDPKSGIVKVPSVGQAAATGNSADEGQ